MPKKLTIESMHSLAEKRKGKCISKEYVNARTKLEWQCSKGHRWKATPDNIKHDKWCPECAGRGKTISDMQKLARARKGRCLSKEYLGGQKKLNWRCSEGHEWEATPSNISRNKWCPDCAGTKRKTIKDAQALAHKQKGRCLSKKYINNATKLEWECKEGHHWKATYGNISQGKWCWKCGRIESGKKQRLTIQDMQKLGAAKKGRCLSRKYGTAHTKLKWECSQRHKWNASPSNIKSGKWCPYCANLIPLTLTDVQKEARKHKGQLLSKRITNARTKVKWRCKNGHEWEQTPDVVRRGVWCPHCAANAPISLAMLQKNATERGGWLLSKSYYNKYKEKLLWRCAHGHEWKAAPSDIRSGQWCPKCSQGVGERLCRAFFEQLFQVEFKKVKPEWL